MSELFKLPSDFLRRGCRKKQLVRRGSVTQDVGWTTARSFSQQGPSLFIGSACRRYLHMAFKVWGRANQHEVFFFMTTYLSYNLDKALSPLLITCKVCYEMWPCFSGIAPKVTLQSLPTLKNHYGKALPFRSAAEVHAHPSAHYRSLTNALCP